MPGEKTVLGRNPHYFGFDKNKQRLPYLDELVFLVVPDQDAADLKFRAGGVDGVDDVKPENYRWYEDNQGSGTYKLHDLGAAQNTHIVWFNLNRVQPPLRGQKPVPGKKLGDTFVDPVKYRVVQQRRVPQGRLDGHRSRRHHQKSASRSATKTGVTVIEAGAFIS